MQSMCHKRFSAIIFGCMLVTVIFKGLALRSRQWLQPCALCLLGINKGSFLVKVKPKPKPTNATQLRQAHSALVELLLH